MHQRWGWWNPSCQPWQISKILKWLTTVTWLCERGRIPFLLRGMYCVWMHSTLFSYAQVILSRIRVKILVVMTMSGTVVGLKLPKNLSVWSLSKKYFLKSKSCQIYFEQKRVYGCWNWFSCSIVTFVDLEILNFESLRWGALLRGLSSRCEMACQVCHPAVDKNIRQSRAWNQYTGIPSQQTSAFLMKKRQRRTWRPGVCLALHRTVHLL